MAANLDAVCSVMDEEEFRRCCQLLLQRSEQLKDGWSWVAVQGSEEGYLRKTALRSVVLDSSRGWDQEGESSETEPGLSCQDVEQTAPVADGIHWDCEDDDVEGACLRGVSEDSSQLLQHDYHILYSCSYSTPVLYFRASTLEGRSLSLQEVWSSVHPNFRLRLLNSPLNTITLQEHPLLGQPFFMVHPCRTEEFMRPILQAAQDQHRTVNYVVSWLSVVGPLVGLEVSLKYSTQIHPVDPGSSTAPG
ncbi:uncharacterized protein V6R79_020915 [Siganus canaliculatus]